jgi:GNAT superfamily N-acetyltransferase
MIRVATNDDRALILALRAEFEAEVPDELWHDDDPDYEWTHVLLADDVGFAALDKKGDRTWLLDILYVKPEARGKGLGVELIRAAAELAKEQGAEMLALEVQERNASARRLYERLGFSTHERLLATPIAGLLAAPDPAQTFGFVHVQYDDVEKVKHDATKFLLVEPEAEVEGGWIRVRSDATDADPERLKALAKELSYTTPGVTLSIGVEGGMVVRYNLFDRGADMDEYLSVPEFYGELPPGDVYALGSNPTVVARLTNGETAAVRAVARTAASPAELPPAQELYEQIADVLGIKP